MIKTGIDIVKISRLKELSDSAKKKIFHPSEINRSIQSLAGIFAAKEAVKKALGTSIDWLDIEIKKRKNGRPYIILRKKIKQNIDLSIAHDGDYAIAMVIWKK